MLNRSSLRLAATLLVIGEVLFVLVGLFHPAREPANSHTAVFTEYAQSGTWTAVHLGQFLTMGVILAGLLVLFVALDSRVGMLGWLARFAALSVVVTLTLTGVLQAVDGVALKQAVDAWANAPAQEQAARFASAETVRWLEWGVRSYQRIMLGVSLVLFAITIVSTRRIPRLVGCVMGLSGIAYLLQGWIVGAEGFSDNGTIPGLLAFVFDFVWIVWLAIVAWRMNDSGPSTSAERSGPTPAAVTARVS
jgi:hypothetical protein